jgi:hypothetical protein
VFLKLMFTSFKKLFIHENKISMFYLSYLIFYELIMLLCANNNIEHFVSR